MNISTGISEIKSFSAHGVSPAGGKTYIWPVYTNGKVEKIKSLQSRSPEPLYFKPSPAEQSRIFESMQKSQSEYNAAGKINRSSTHIQPGSLFSAIA